jgi:hypothetical protein
MNGDEYLGYGYETAFYEDRAKNLLIINNVYVHKHLTKPKHRRSWVRADR